jgi:hypothetical protein
MTTNLNYVTLYLCGDTIEGYDCGLRWNGFVVPLFEASQLDDVVKLVGSDCSFAPMDYYGNNCNLLYSINAGFCFELSE